MEFVALVTVCLLILHWRMAYADPSAPLFSVSPKQDIYTTGDLISLTCLAPDKRNMSRIIFLSNKWVLYFHNPTPAVDTFMHSLHLSAQDSGDYSCMYYVLESGREIPSQRSSSIFISVMDPPPPPVLKIDPPSRVVNEGDPLLLTCSAKENHIKKSFHFYRDGVEMVPSNDGSLQVSREPGDTSPNASVSIWQASLNHSGEFACRYKEKMSSDWRVSPWSQKVCITVWASNSSAPPLLYACMAIPLMILMAPLAFYCGRKTSECKQGNKEEADTEYVEMFSPNWKPHRLWTPAQPQS
ncbi:high affinity immunoglobulin epsilon receptor subunit alpha [Rhineura floridana]|uniref:high affinity immunoglobulin epsilon receptor subunit alpha n=1 Tax=Rhineura floridana TaxID=261503 RepID=UPI002AC82CC0|nr:high affinity immunoglobulin epsilon receptor subunit alpha [Rhineura floridana]